VRCTSGHRFVLADDVRENAGVEIPEDSDDSDGEPELRGIEELLEQEAEEEEEHKERETLRGNRAMGLGAFLIAPRPG
jgi:hypothetical protein